MCYLQINIISISLKFELLPKHKQVMKVFQLITIQPRGVPMLLKPARFKTVK